MIPFRHLLGRVIAALLACQHHKLGSLFWHRGDRHYRCCQDCGQLVESPLTHLPDIKPVPPPGPGANVNWVAQAAEVRLAYEEQVAIREPMRVGWPAKRPELHQIYTEDLERLWRKS